MTDELGSHVQELMPALLNGSLSPAQVASARAHVARCPRCQNELAEWEAIRMATGAITSAAVPPVDVPAGVWTAIAGDRATSRTGHSPWRPALLAWQLLAGQLPLVRAAIWTASAVTMFAGCLVALYLAGPIESGLILAMVAPLVAAVGVAFVYGPENDPGLELALATPTPPQLVLAARLTLVYGFDLVLALLAALALAIHGGADLWPLISLWLGPMLFLSALTLVLSLLWGSAVAITAAMGLWLMRLIVALDSGRTRDLGTFTELGESFWQRTPLLIALAALLLLLALVYAPRQERFSVQ